MYTFRETPGTGEGSLAGSAGVADFIVAHAPSNVEDEVLRIQRYPCRLAGQKTLLRAASPLLATPARELGRSRSNATPRRQKTQSFCFVWPSEKCVASRFSVPPRGFSPRNGGTLT
jgi:hypothetical protein